MHIHTQTKTTVSIFLESYCGALGFLLAVCHLQSISWGVLPHIKGHAETVVKPMP